MPAGSDARQAFHSASRVQSARYSLTAPRAEGREAIATGLQAFHTGGVRKTEVGAHAVGCPLYRHHVLLLNKRHHKIGVAGDKMAAGAGFSDKCLDVDEQIEGPLRLMGSQTVNTGKTLKHVIAALAIDFRPFCSRSCGPSSAATDPALPGSSRRRCFAY